MYNMELSETMNKMIDFIVEDYEEYGIDLNDLDGSDDAIRDAFNSNVDSDLIYYADQQRYIFDEMGITDWAGYGYGEPITNLSDLAYAVAEFEFFDDGGYSYLIERLEELRDEQDEDIEFSRKVRGRKVTASRRPNRRIMSKSYIRANAWV